MTDEERNNRPDNRTSATNEFIKWYKRNYQNGKKLVKQLPANYPSFPHDDNKKD